MAVLTAYRQLLKGRIRVSPEAFGERVGTTCVAVDAFLRHLTAEAEVNVLVTGGKLPSSGFRIVRERSLKKIAAATNQKRQPVLARAHDVIEPVRYREHARLRLTL